MEAVNTDIVFVLFWVQTTKETDKTRNVSEQSTGVIEYLDLRGGKKL